MNPLLGSFGRSLSISLISYSASDTLCGGSISEPTGVGSRLKTLRCSKPWAEAALQNGALWGSFQALRVNSFNGTSIAMRLGSSSGMFECFGCDVDMASGRRCRLISVKGQSRGSGR